LNYATVCSGIGAPEVAWSELWGPPVFTSEIEAFPSAVLKHHMPEVPNYGDMTKYKEWPEHELELICGGTPCQSFSVAGLRKGMDDPRGNLALTYLGIIDKYRPSWVVWENVPGVLSSNGGRDFGAFLGALGQLGYGYAYRVLDAQYFGVPQRRRRVFVVGYIGDWRPPYAVLFEPQGMRRDTEKGGKEGQGLAAFTPGSIGGYREGCGTVRAAGGDVGGDVGGGSETLVMAHGQGNAEVVKDGEPSLTCNHEAPIAFCQNQAGDVLTNEKMHSLATNPNATGRNAPCVAVNARQDPITSECAQPLDQKGNSQAVAFQRSELRQRGTLTMHDKAPTLKAETKQGDSELTILQPISFRACGQQGFKPDKITPPVCATDGGGAGAPTVAFSSRMRGPEPKVNRPARPPHAMIELTGALEAIKPWNVVHDTIVRRLTPMECERLQGFPDGYTLIPNKGKRGKNRWYAAMLVHLARRDSAIATSPEGYFYTDLALLEALACCPDTPRYKALGNSMAVPVVEWIGRRIQLWEELNGRT
jgi:DNA (cytosine-5)-methyltransferase 1